LSLFVFLEEEEEEKEKKNREEKEGKEKENRKGKTNIERRRGRRLLTFSNDIIFVLCFLLLIEFVNESLDIYK
jgi:hypothetical protein